MYPNYEVTNKKNCSGFIRYNYFTELFAEFVAIRKNYKISYNVFIKIYIKCISILILSEFIHLSKVKMFKQSYSNSSQITDDLLN